MAFLVCAVVLCIVMAGATDAPLEQGRINQLSVCLSLSGGSAPNMIPLVYEHFGHWGSEAESFLCHLAKKSRNVEGQQNTVEFLNYWRRRFSVSLQRCNTKVVLKKISRLSCGVNEESRLFDRDIHISVH